ncbi:hypothetical protein AJ78_05567 [Emergomyces pasteurianus Ep9510]|uniref:Esterase n=1 Tax=Emergomyces pasteurianus Ep9510 TaxID=1447872 RepID=A0A1J9QFW1_9EURO|nr:hypothetical protein AJ78_05567 [Emergomyces pasteurianus Ep9510]
MSSPPIAVTVQNSAQWDLESPDGQTYRIQVSWPMHWKNRMERNDVPAFYIADGNAMFLSATEAACRRATGPHFSGGGLIIAIGYPLDSRVYSPRRNCDLTPPASPCPDGYGGAEKCLDFIQDVVKPFIKTTAFPNATICREALFGHSFGGLFTLYALYSRPSLFNGFVASSPSVEWNNYCIESYENKFRNRKPEPEREFECPSLMIFYGSYEQDPHKWADESPEDFEQRLQFSHSRPMTDNAIALHRRLKESAGLRCVTVKGYQAEDHGTVMACALSRSLTTFFEEWPL